MTQLKSQAEIAAEAHAVLHDPGCKWLHCPGRLAAEKSFKAGVEWGDKLAKEEVAGLVDALEEIYNGDDHYRVAERALTKYRERIKKDDYAS